MNNFHTVISKYLFLNLIFLWEVTQGISRTINFVLIVIYLEVVWKSFLGLANLLGAQTVWFYETLKIIEIYDNNNLTFVDF